MRAGRDLQGGPKDDPKSKRKVRGKPGVRDPKDSGWGWTSGKVAWPQGGCPAEGAQRTACHVLRIKASAWSKPMHGGNAV